MFLFSLAFKSDEKASDYEHYPSILVSFVGKIEHFSVHFSAETKASRKEGELFLPLCQLKYSSLLGVLRFTIYLILTHKS